MVMVTGTVLELDVALGPQITAAEARAIFSQGEEVVIARHGTPVAKLVAIPQRERVLGTLKGRLTAESDWDSAISDDQAEQEFGL